MCFSRHMENAANNNTPPTFEPLAVAAANVLNKLRPDFMDQPRAAGLLKQGLRLTLPHPFELVSGACATLHNAGPGHSLLTGEGGRLTAVNEKSCNSLQPSCGPSNTMPGIASQA